MFFPQQYKESGGTVMTGDMRKKVSGKDAGLKLIVLYSADQDFCMSFTLLFQDRYKVVTVPTLDMLLLAVEQYRPALVIADAVPNERIGSRFDTIKRLNPDLPIILFYVTRLEPNALKESVLKYVDAIFSKPIDLTQVTTRINELVSRN